MEDLFSISIPLIEIAEGLRLFPYKDTMGHLTIGYGRNLEAKGISKNIAELMLKEDIQDAINGCKEKIDFFDNLDIQRQYVLINLAVNMGVGGLLAFEKMLTALKEKRYNDAARELENSLENKEVPNRVHPLIKILETGEISRDGSAS